MRLQPSDIIEIETAAGLGYAQVTHIHPAYPEVVRFFRGPRPGAVKDLAGLSENPTAFIAMFPLGGALETGMLVGRKIGALPIPSDFKSFPTFKMPIRDKQGAVVYWWLWEGNGLSYSVEEDGSYDAMPMREVMTVSDLIGRLGGSEDVAA